MIDYISGPVADITPATAVIDCNGIGYEINITLLDYSSLKIGCNAKFYIHESIREDAHVLYGFLSRHSRELFRLLIGVSGVGPNTGRLILSSIESSALEQAIASGQDSVLKGVKGIGLKTAQRIIVDLKDKIKPDQIALSSSVAMASEVFEDSQSALVMLGFSAQQSQKVLKKIFEADPAITTEKAVKQALKML